MDVRNFRGLTVSGFIIKTKHNRRWRVHAKRFTVSGFSMETKHDFVMEVYPSLQNRNSKSTKTLPQFQGFYCFEFDYRYYEDERRLIEDDDHDYDER